MLRRHYTSLAFWAATKREALLIADVDSETDIVTPEDAILSLDTHSDVLSALTTEDSSEMREAA